MNIRRRPMEERYYNGKLLCDSVKVENSTWFDVEGCKEARITIFGMGLGDKVAIRVANTVDRPKDGQGVWIAKPYTKDLEARLSHYKWVRAEHVESGGLGSVTVDFFGWN